MTQDERNEDELGAARRRILRRAALYTYGFMAMAVVVAVGGAAFLAWIFGAMGLPFLPTWIVLSLLTLGIPLIGHGLLQLRDRVRAARRDHDTSND